VRDREAEPTPLRQQATREADKNVRRFLSWTSDEHVDQIKRFDEQWEPFDAAM